MFFNIKIKIVAVFTFVTFTALFFAQNGSTQTKGETAGQKFKNIKVLTNMPVDQMGKVMNLVSASLGVNCNFCHIGDDFEKDGKKEKDAAREMMKMTFELNKTHFEGRPEISCNTCHSGHEHPMSVPNLSPKIEEGRPKQPDKKPAVDAILAKYRAALGGEAKLDRVTSRTIKANRIEPDGKTIEPEEIWQKANKLLVKTTYGKYFVAEGFDGKQAWKTGISEKSSVKTDETRHTTGLFIDSEITVIALKSDEAEQIKREAEIFANPDLKIIYTKLDFRFVDKIDGKEVYLVTGTMVDGSRERLYFDIVTGFLIRRVASTPTILGNFQYQVDYSDYKDFGGVKLPATIRFAVPNINWTRKILDVKNNVNIDDAQFMR